MLNYYAAIEINPVICEEDRPGITMLSEASWIIERPTHGLAHVESGKKINQDWPRDMHTG